MPMRDACPNREVTVARHRAHRFGKWRLSAAAARCLADASGVTAIEYALIAGIVVIAIASLVNGIGASVSQMFSSVAGGF
jgi:pilus assembly protein Flp/PilA